MNKKLVIYLFIYKVHTSPKKFYCRKWGKKLNIMANTAAKKNKTSYGDVKSAQHKVKDKHKAKQRKQTLNEIIKYSVPARLLVYTKMNTYI